MLIVEGPDNLGKTVLCRELVRDAWKRGIPAHYGHMGRPNVRFDFLTHYYDMMSYFGVYDRFHLGSLVWHQAEMNRLKMKEIEKALQHYASLVVIVTPSDDYQDSYIEKIRSSDRKEMFDPNKIIDSIAVYRDLVSGESVQDVTITQDRLIDLRVDEFPTDKDRRDILNHWIDLLEKGTTYDRATSNPGRV